MFLIGLCSMKLCLVWIGLLKYMGMCSSGLMLSFRLMWLNSDLRLMLVG